MVQKVLHRSELNFTVRAVVIESNRSESLKVILSD